MLTRKCVVKHSGYNTPQYFTSGEQITIFVNNKNTPGSGIISLHLRLGIYILEFDHFPPPSRKVISPPPPLVLFIGVKNSILRCIRLSVRQFVRPSVSQSVSAKNLNNILLQSVRKITKCDAHCLFDARKPDKNFWGKMLT